ncbi:MAG: branched-chain amino acid ABC transporter permease [Chloroflexota bacterium]
MMKELGITIPAIADRYGLRGGRVVSIVLALILFTVPLWGNPYLVSIFINIGLYSIIALGLVLLTGLAGQVSLGQAVFYGIGAYTSALLALRFGVPPGFGVVVAGTVAGLVAVPIGRAIFRLRGIIVAGVTLTVNLIFFYLVVSISDLTGGATGLVLIPRFEYPSIMRYSTFVFFLVWMTAVVCLILALNLARSRVGRALKSVNILAGGSEDTAQVLGVDVMHFKTGAYVVAAVFAGVAGAVYAHYVTVIEPHTFSAQTSVVVAIMVIVGGVTSPWGAVLGAGLIVGITEVLREVAPVVLGGSTGAYELVAYGAVLILTLLFLPEGLFSLPARIGRRREN